ncbi:MAG: POTRA domain-containing protein [Woeseia sp.]
MAGRLIARLCALYFSLYFSSGMAASDLAGLPTGQQLEAAGAVIGQIRFERNNVFDLSLPEENNPLYRLANRLHVLTREDVIRQQLLFRPGDSFSARLVAESERILRANGYFYDARIRVAAYQNGVVDLVVTTRDVWTLIPGFSISRKGGENRTRVSLSEENLFGTGARIKLAYIDDVDRESTSLEYGDRNLGNSWWSIYTRIADNSDGDSQLFVLQQPFYALHTRNAQGLSLYANDAETRFYELGNEVAEYRAESRVATAFYGWSAGLQDGWVRRFRAGVTFDEQDFSETAEQLLPQLLPADRKLVYPWLGIELFEDRFETASNRDQIERTEDFFVGRRLTAQLGIASRGLGSDRSAVPFNVSASRGFGSLESRAFLLSSELHGRIESGDLVNALWQTDGRYYLKLSDKSLVYTTLSVALAGDLDLDAPLSLGGDSGLRGYPLRYQVGDKRVLLTAEYRYFTNWYPFRLVRVGGAVFADVGRTFGDNPAGGKSLGWLKDVGIGLRFMPTRASGREIVHLDLAFPLDGDPSIDSLQILLESKRSF